MASIGDKLVESARQALAIAQGEADPATYRVSHIADVNVKAIRKKLAFTQREFAAKFGFAIEDLRSWELRQSVPDAVSRNYLRVIHEKPTLVLDILNAA